MKTSSLPLLIVVGLTSLLGSYMTAAHSQAPARRNSSVLSTLTVGQTVGLRVRNSAWEISTLDEVDSGSHQVAEVGEDFIVLKDVSGLTETRIPITAITAIVHVRIKK